jgi:hypothetical protein
MIKHSTQPLTTKDQFVLSNKCFNRFICGLFERQTTYPRLALAFVAISQYYLLMLFSMMCWLPYLFWLVFALMRGAQLGL